MKKIKIFFSYLVMGDMSYPKRQFKVLVIGHAPPQMSLQGKLQRNFLNPFTQGSVMEAFTGDSSFRVCG